MKNLAVNLQQTFFTMNETPTRHTKRNTLGLLSIALGLFSTSSVSQTIELTLNTPNNASAEYAVISLFPSDEAADPKLQQSLKAASIARQTTPVFINQSDKAFNPVAAVAQVGQPVVFRNQDNITHHIYSAASTTSFSFKIRAGVTRPAMTFENTGAISMGCNIHDWMSGYLMIVDTPFYAQVDKNGKAQIDIPQAGNYTVSIWHPRLDVKQQTEQHALQFNAQQNRYAITMKHKIKAIVEQSQEEEFDFLDDY